MMTITFIDDGLNAEFQGEREIQDMFKALALSSWENREWRKTSRCSSTNFSKTAVSRI